MKWWNDPNVIPMIGLAMAAIVMGLGMMFGFCVH